MTPEQLKSSILQQAIEGKLVPQDPAEGTAEELYQQIQAEKARLIKEKKIKKEKPLPEITEEEIPFEIPESWKWVRLNSICNEIVDCPHSTPKYYLNDTGFKTIDTNCIDQKGDITGWRYVDSDTYTKRTQRLIPHKNDVVLTREGSIGRAVILPDYKICLGQRVMLLRPASLISSVYLKWYLMSGSTLARLTEKQKGLGAKHINVSDIVKLSFPLPPIAEQKRIVTKIEQLLPLVEQYGKAYERLQAYQQRFPEDLKKSILQEAIQGKLVPQDPKEGSAEDLYRQIQAEKARLIKEKKIKKEKPLPEITEEEIPFEIPESWKWVRLGDISSYGKSKEKVTASEIKPDFWSLDLEDIEKTSGNIIRKVRAKDREIRGERVVFHKGDILYSKLRPYLLKILVAPDDGITSPEIIPFKVYGEESQDYYMMYLKSPYVTQVVNDTSYGVKMPRVGTGTMENLLVPLPPLAEQKRIVAKIESLLPLVEKLQKKE